MAFCILSAPNYAVIISYFLENVNSLLRYEGGAMDFDIGWLEFGEVAGEGLDDQIGFQIEL